jgi:hypothetical protein
MILFIICSCSEIEKPSSTHYWSTWLLPQPQHRSTSRQRRLYAINHLFVPTKDPSIVWVWVWANTYLHLSLCLCFPFLNHTCKARLGEQKRTKGFSFFLLALAYRWNPAHYLLGWRPCLSLPEHAHVIMRQLRGVRFTSTVVHRCT